MNKTERDLRREIPLEEIPTTAQPIESLAAAKTYVAPSDLPKAKAKRTVSSRAQRRQKEGAEKGKEMKDKLEKRRSSVEGKKEKKKRAKAAWD